MIPVDKALQQIHACISPLPSEVVALENAAGRVLAEPVRAQRDQPPLPVSAMDGYAIRQDDLPVQQSFRLAGEVRAGGPQARTVVESGQAVRIFTGAPMPPGTDHVIIQEHVSVAGNTIVLDGPVPPASFVRPAGGDFQQGFAINPPKRLTPTDLALIAAMNHSHVTVTQRPRVAIVPTGDELRMPGGVLADHEIVASNVYGLQALLQAAGGLVTILPIATDTTGSISQLLADAADADLILTIGGASVGTYDKVRTAADHLGLALAFHGVAMRPGKPTMAGLLGTSVLLGLPGNPVSALVCGVVLARPAILFMQGLDEVGPSRTTVPLAAGIGANGDREHYARARLVGTQPDQGLVFHDRQDSSLLSVLGTADVLAIRPVNDPPRQIGDPLDCIPLAGLLN